MSREDLLIPHIEDYDDSCLDLKLKLSFDQALRETIDWRKLF